MHILIDALHINNGGGRVLLEYIIDEARKKGPEIHLLLDSRIDPEQIDTSGYAKVTFMPAGLISRTKFYLRNRTRYRTVLCYGNLPPYITLPRSTVYTYYQQLLFLNPSLSVRSAKDLILAVKVRILNTIKKATNYWIVPSETVQRMLAEKFSIPRDSILVWPIYRLVAAADVNYTERIKGQLLYVSNAYPHKNHIRLIEAFTAVYDRIKKGKLVLTVSEEYEEVSKLIELKKAQGYPVENHGFVSSSALSTLYHQSEYLVFPSVAECLGLGLVEAIECGCKVLGADMEYTHQVCKASLVFDPFETTAIEKALEQALTELLPEPEIRIRDHIKELVGILK